NARDRKRKVAYKTMSLIALQPEQSASPRAGRISPRVVSAFALRSVSRRMRGSVSSVARRIPTQRSLRASVCSVLKLERHGGHRESRFGCLGRNKPGQALYRMVQAKPRPYVPLARYAPLSGFLSGHIIYQVAENFSDCHPEEPQAVLSGTKEGSPKLLGMDSRFRGNEVRPLILQLPRFFSRTAGSK